MDRRQFLKRSMQFAGSMSASGALGQLFTSAAMAQSTSSYKAVVCLFLAGGLDSNNLIVPRDDAYAKYTASRGNLAYGKDALLSLKQTSKGRSFGLHPAMAQTAALYNQGYAAVLANTGPLARPTTKNDFTQSLMLPNDLFSHSGQQAEWNTSISQGASPTGWAGRVADAIASTNGSGKMPAVVSTSGFSLMGQGANTTEATASDGLNTANLLSAIANVQSYMVNGETGTMPDPVQGYVSSTQQGFLATAKTINDVYQSGSGLRTMFPSTPIGQQLAAVAQMIKGRTAHDTNRQIFVCTDGGYDTHVNQLQVSQASLYALDQAISAFTAAMQELGMFGNVTLFTVSDFSRTLLQNTSFGSDHGWGGHHLIVGGAVKGGDVYGTFPSLVAGGDEDCSTLGVWIPTTSTSQYTATLSSWLGVPGSKLATIFPELSNFPNQTVGFL